MSKSLLPPDIVIGAAYQDRAGNVSYIGLTKWGAIGWGLLALVLIAI